MASDLATLSITVDANQAKRELTGLDAAFGKLKGAAAALGVTLSAGLLFKKFIDETSAAQHATAQLEARIKSTGGAAGQSMGALTAYASEMQRLTTFSDEAVMSAQAMLLTFTRIRGDVFPAATKAVADLATAMGGDMKGAAIQVGKALNDPVLGISALTRVGVSFTKEQKAVIESLVETGRVADAQRLILRELETEFGGAAEAARNTLGGALTGLKNAWGELFEASRESSQGMIDAINGLIAFLPRLRDAFNAVFGGIRLLYVDVVSHIQQGNAAMYRDTAKLLSFIGSGLALIPGFTKEAVALMAKAQELRTEADTLSDAFAAWKKEQTALITGTQKLGQALTVTTSAGELATKTALDGAVADLRAARAKAELTAAAERQLAIEDERARRAKLGPAGVIGGFAAAAGRSEAGNVTSAREEIERFGAYTIAVDKRTSDQILNGRAQMRARDFEAHLQHEAAKQGVAIDKMKEEEQIRENFLRQFQQTFANGIADMLQSGLSAWRGFFDSIRQLGINALADIFSRRLMEGRVGDIIGAIGGSGGGAKSSGAFGLSANALGGIAGIAIAVGTVVTNLQAQAAESARAAHEFQQATVAWDRAYKDFIASFNANDVAARFTDLRAKFQKQLESLPGVFGSPDIEDPTAFLRSKNAAVTLDPAFIQRVRDLSAAYESQRKALEALLVFQERMAASDLRVRDLRLRGLDDEAAALDLFNRQVQEFGEAIKKGFSPELLAELSRIQGLERLKLASDQAAEAQRKLADAQLAAAEAAKRAAEAQAEAQARAAEAAQRVSQAIEDLGVRLLRAQGKSEEAERRAMELSHQREAAVAQFEFDKAEREAARYMKMIQLANNNWIGQDPAARLLWETEIASNRELAKLWKEYLEKLKEVQAAEVDALGRPDTMPGASVVPGTEGSFHTIVSRTTAEQGDRMVDALTSARIYLADIAESNRAILKKLGGGLNAILGGDLQSAQALAGSSLVA